MILRRLNGERRGAGSELGQPDVYKASLAFYSPSIAIETQALLADISFYQGEIDWQKMSALQGVIIRAGQRTWEDSQFKVNWAGAKSAGIPRGSYWFYDSREKPENQAALWWSLLKGDVGELVHAADFEESYGGPYGTTAHMRTFLSEFQRLSGLPNERLAVYTGYYWWADRTAGDPWFAKYWLWLAWYAQMANVRIPPPWVSSGLLFWQFTSSGDGQLYGVSSKEIDLSWYRGTLAEFQKQFGTTDPGPGGQDPGGSMSYYEGKAPSNIDTWTDPSGSKTGIIRAGDTVRGPAPSGTFTKLSLPNAYTKSSFLSPSWYKLVVTEPPPVEPPPTGPTLTHTIQVYSDGSIKIDGSPYV